MDPCLSDGIEIVAEALYKQDHPDKTWSITAAVAEHWRKNIRFDLYGVGARTIHEVDEYRRRATQVVKQMKLRRIHTNTVDDSTFTDCEGDV